MPQGSIGNFYGRAAVRATPASHVTFVSLEDDLMRVFYGRKLRPLINNGPRGAGAGCPVSGAAVREPCTMGQRKRNSRYPQKPA